MEKYSKVYILSFPFDIFRRCRYFCELSVSELNTSACVSVEWSRELCGVLSKGHAFLHYSEFDATTKKKMLLHFAFTLRGDIFFLI